jgi:hypothetical protein
MAKPVLGLGEGIAEIETIENRDSVTLRQQLGDEHGADVASTTGDENMHIAAAIPRKRRGGQWMPLLAVRRYRRPL